MYSEKIEKIFNQSIKSKYVHECVLLVENSKGDFSYKNTFWEKSIDSPILMASITKMLTATAILILNEQGKLSLDDHIAKFFDRETLNKLHNYKGQDYSSKLTISNLLFQTSGLPDAYEEGKDKVKRRVIIEDLHYTFEDMMARTKQMQPHFPPTNPKRAHYADVNYELLGRIIENITQTPLEQVFKQLIFDPLELQNTYLPISEEEYIPKIYFKESAFSRPKFIISSRASGGAISTAREMMNFLKAFFGGKLFNKDIFRHLKTYHKLQLTMYPIQYGGGFMRIPLGGFATMFMGSGELIGHSGSTGSFAFYYPEKDLYFVGDVNQAANPMSVRMAMRLAIAVSK